MNWLYAFTNLGLELVGLCSMVTRCSKWKFKLKSLFFFLVFRTIGYFSYVLQCSFLSFCTILWQQKLEMLHFCFVYWIDAVNIVPFTSLKYIWIATHYLTHTHFFAWTEYAIQKVHIQCAWQWQYSLDHFPKGWSFMKRCGSFDRFLVWWTVRKPIQIVDIKWLMCRKVLNYRTHWEASNEMSFPNKLLLIRLNGIFRWTNLLITNTNILNR